MQSQLSKIITPEEANERRNKVGHDIVALAVDIAAGMDANPGFAAGLRTQGWNPREIERYERLGRKQLHPQLMFAVSIGATRLQKLSFSVQEEALKDGIEVLEPSGTDSRIIPVHELSTAQASQVFGPHIRSLTEQRTFIEEKKAKTRPVDNKAAYRYHKGKLVIGDLEFTKEQVLDWLRDLNLMQ